MRCKRIEDYQIFFEQNPSIRSFSCSQFFLRENEDWLLTTGVKLDYLEINGIQLPHDLRLIDRLFSLVKQLHVQGFYKKLRVKMNQHRQDAIKQISKLPAVERVIIQDYSININLDFPIMVDVKEIRFKIDNLSMNFEKLVTKFPNVERAHLCASTFDQVVVNFKRLKKLRALNLGIISSENPILNLKHCRMLNDEREKLPEASKVRIYLRAHIYLATKWACSNREFKFTEIRCSKSWPYDF